MTMRRDVHVDSIAQAQPRARLHHLAVDLDVTLVDQAAHLRPGERPLAGAQRLGQELIEPPACRGRDDGCTLRGRSRVGREPGSDLEPPVLAPAGSGYQIFDFTCPFDFTSTSTRARS
jgi:hypothetical protein